jgi:hypothetical protein
MLRTNNLTAHRQSVSKTVCTKDTLSGSAQHRVSPRISANNCYRNLEPARIQKYAHKKTWVNFFCISSEPKLSAVSPDMTRDDSQSYTESLRVSKVHTI